MKRKLNRKLLTAAGTVAGVALGASMALAAHRPVTLYTYEELATQFGMPKMPVMVDANGKGMPYSPKQTCSGTTFADGTVDPLGCHSYSNIASHAFHADQGVSEIKDLTVAGDAATTGITRDGQFSTVRNKPWTQSVGMIGKW